MSKLVLNDVTSGYASTTLVNANNTAIETALENTLSRDGTGPNQMGAALDMNGNMILNQANPITVSGFNWEGPWVTGTTYQVGDVVETGGTSYICIVEHTASALFATDSASWQTVAEASFPTQAGSANKFLQTNGTSTSWETPDSSEVSFSQAGTGTVATTVQTKLREYVSVTDKGALGDGNTSDQDAIVDAIATGKDVYFPKPSVSYVMTANIPLTTPGQRLFGEGWGSIIQADTATFNLFTPQADGIIFEDLRFNGKATSNATTQFAIFTATANPANYVKVSRCKFSGNIAGEGLNNAVKFDDACDFGSVTECIFERLYGNISGTGYGVLAGAVDGLHIVNNHWFGSSGRGRHGFYLSTGATSCKILSNHVSAADYEGITLNSTGVQPANASNTIAFNTLTGCCAALSGATSGSISIFGHADGNIILGNTIRGSRDCGIMLDGTGYTDLKDTQIKQNTVIGSYYKGIYLRAAVGGALVGNTIIESSVASAGTHENIGLVSDGTTATSNWLIASNHSYGPTTSRSAFFLNTTAPTPTDLDVFGNKFDVCVTSDVELNNIVCAIDGYIHYTEANVSYGPIANGASVSTGYVVAGAQQGDVCAVSHTSDSDGCALYAYVSSTGNVTVVVLNNSGGNKTIVSGTLRVDVYRREP